MVAGDETSEGVAILHESRLPRLGVCAHEGRLAARSRNPRGAGAFDAAADLSPRRPVGEGCAPGPERNAAFRKTGRIPGEPERRTRRRCRSRLRPRPYPPLRGLEAAGGARPLSRSISIRSDLRGKAGSRRGARRGGSASRLRSCRLFGADPGQSFS